MVMPTLTLGVQSTTANNNQILGEALTQRAGSQHGIPLKEAAEGEY